MIGILNVYKEKNMTSFDVIAQLRKMLKTKKIGHTGTLDPNATGVLPICIGDATKLVQYILNENKQYYVTVKLGIKTDSADITGKIIEQKAVPKLNIDDIQHITTLFIGKQMQVPPMYSAIKVNGKKLYELAREGIEIERQPRQIEITNITNVTYNSNEQVISFLVDCSKGTYIRTLCENICEKLNTLGTVLELERTKTGAFTKENSYTLQNISTHIIDGTLNKILCSIEDTFSNYMKIDLEEHKLVHFLNGVKLTKNTKDDIYAVYVNNNFIGIGEVKNSLLKRKFVIQ